MKIQAQKSAVRERALYHGGGATFSDHSLRWFPLNNDHSHVCMVECMTNKIIVAKPKLLNLEAARYTENRLVGKVRGLLKLSFRVYSLVSITF
jgi:hypothetical protein